MQTLHRFVHPVLRLLNQLEIKSSGCWEWKGHRNQAGYGEFCVNGERHTRAHRFMWEAIHGSIGSLHVLHKCDNPPCCNPDHLFLGTQQDNMKDRDLKGRVAHGANHYKRRNLKELH